VRRLSAFMDARSVPFIVTVLLAVAGSVYALSGYALDRHGWQSYSDLWNSAGISLAIGHGHFSAAYAPTSQLDSPPGFEVLFSPSVVLGHALGLGTSGSGWHSFELFEVVLVAVATAMGCSVLFALDAVARSWHYSEAKRLALSAVAGLGVVSAVAFWGHPEDCIALAFVIWAALAVERGGSSGAGPPRAGWLLGVAVACQPLALLAVVPVVARFGWRELRAVSWRLVVPPVLVFVPPLLATPARSLHAVVDQPGLPADDSSTPFSHLARSLGHGMYGGGTLRLVATVVALGLGWVACRRRHDLPWVLFVMALCFALRVALESELLGFYFFPVTVLTLLVALRASWTRFELCAAVSVMCLVLGNRRQHVIALWWPGIMATTVAMLVIAYGALECIEDGRVAAGPSEAARAHAEEAGITVSRARLLDR
jgi:hypothetical protein